MLARAAHRFVNNMRDLRMVESPLKIIQKRKRLSTSTIDEKIKDRILLQWNCWISIREMSKEVGISISSCYTTVKRLECTKMASKFILRILTVEQKQHRKQIVAELLQQTETDENFLKEIITEDETWVYEYNVETNAKTSCNQVNRLKKMSSDRRKHA